MKYMVCLLCIIFSCFLYIGCDNEIENGTENGEEEYYTVTINVVNESTLEYRLYLGITDDLYDSNTGTFNLDEGEIVIESIPAGETRSYVMDLDTDPYINKDWLMQYNHIILGWTTVLAEPDTDSDGYIFTGNETYTIMISSTGSFSIQMD